MTADYEVRVASYGPRCPACGVTTEPREGGLCWVPGCPCFKLAPLSPEAIAVARTASFTPQLSVNGRGMTGLSALRQLDGQQSDPVEARALSRMRETERRPDDRTSVSDALAWVRAHNPRNVGPDE